MPVFRIRDILVRIWIQGSVHLTNGFGSSSELCFSSVFKTPTKNDFFFLLFEGTFEFVLKDKNSQRNHKRVRIKVFLTFLLDDGMIRTRTSEIKEAEKLILDPDPEHLKLYREKIKMEEKQNKCNTARIIVTRIKVRVST